MAKFWGRLRGLVLLVLLMAGAARAGTISMQVSCRADGTNLLVRLENRGDEAAQNVSARVMFQGEEYTTPPVNALPPSQPIGAMIGLRQGPTPGTFPAVITVHFEDLNAYPFSSVTILPIRIEPAGPSPLMAKLEGGKIRGKRALKAQLHNPSAQTIDATVQVVAARELIAEAPVARVEIPANGQARLSIPVENFSAMPASRYAIHLLLEHEADGRHYTTVTSATVQIFPRSPWQSPGFWVLLGVALVAILISLWRGLSHRSKLPA